MQETFENILECQYEKLLFFFFFSNREDGYQYETFIRIQIYNLWNRSCSVGSLNNILFNTAKAMKIKVMLCVYEPQIEY